MKLFVAILTFFAFLQESHEIIVSGLKSVWPNLPLQSEENDGTMIEVDPLPSKLDVEIEEMLGRSSSGDVDIPMSKYYNVVHLLVTCGIHWYFQLNYLITDAALRLLCVFPCR